ncbi:hypothetical protein H310_01891 [Aphanomyces invadans]|uniref:Uncharacterized protein n=1 Tax=Aphanomyces invadans TaxID=157072 RepID=A0A024UMF6_9STRA|nr:hypothetical protein H310_01891 [Aphanomyces invadans]ETW07355.1 hypothetical protein H310_01891 [Aphanomyces invadans]|eukprot:XP_008863448.1 hypothetical protein H310_01891 [Aphanomyces invadans]
MTKFPEVKSLMTIRQLKGEIQALMTVIVNSFLLHFT